MAIQSQITILLQGVKKWNTWRKNNPKVEVDLSGFDFNTIEPQYTYDTNNNSYPCQLWHINLSYSNLRGAIMSRLHLQEVDFSHSNLERAILNDVVFKFANLKGANLQEANLKGTRIIGSDLSDANLTRSLVFGISPWKVNLTNTIQNDLIITPPGESVITVDNIKIAQFIYSIIENDEIKDTINTITNKVVLILGRFTENRKRILDTIRESLRKLDLIPIIFDFAKPNKSTDETINLLAKLSCFVIADITDAKSVLQELRGIVPDSPATIICPILLNSQEEPGMFDFFKKYPWVLKTLYYNESDVSNKRWAENVIRLCQDKKKELNQ